MKQVCGPDAGLFGLQFSNAFRFTKCLSPFHRVMFQKTGFQIVFYQPKKFAPFRFVDLFPSHGQSDRIPELMAMKRSKR